MEMEVKQKIKGLYEKFPYPHYPLLAKLNWNESHLNASDLAQKLATLKIKVNDLSADSSRSKNILIAGCGEALPYVSRKIEPWFYPIVGVDLSHNSIQRARLRTSLSLGRIDLKAQDLVEYLNEKNTPKFSHMEAFGVLHHMPSISAFLDAFEQKSFAGCTMRVMVYNNHARHWIHNIQKFLRDIKIHFDHPKAPLLVQELVNFLCESNPHIQEKIYAMGDSILKNQTRLMDNFLHCFELRWHYPQWVENLNHRHFKVTAFYDRYDELDHLPNPMWCPPDPHFLNDLSAKDGYGGNFEFWAVKSVQGNESKDSSSKQDLQSLNYFLKTLKVGLRLSHQTPLSLQHLAKEFEVNQHIVDKVWVEHLRFVYNLPSDSKSFLDPLIEKNKIDIEFFQRLARKAFVFPKQFKDKAILDKLSAPILSEEKSELKNQKNTFLKGHTIPEDEILKSKINQWLSISNQSLNKKELNLAIKRLSSILKTTN